MDGFWAEIERAHTPLIELSESDPQSMQVTFLWRAQEGQSEANVHVSGYFLVPLEGRLRIEKLQRLADTDVWYRTYRMPRSALSSYSLGAPQGLVPDQRAHRRATHDGVVFEFFTDPRNPRRYELDEGERVYPVSYFRGPAAPEDRCSDVRDDVARGRVETFEIESRVLGNRRKISIYTPPGYARLRSAPDLLLLFDRESYLSAVPTPTILDNMQKDGILRPIAVVFVSPLDQAMRNNRDAELPPNARFQRFLRKELMPWVRDRYRVTRDPRRSVVAGSSYGGIASSYTAFTNPDLFGNALSQSGSYWWWPQATEHMTLEEQRRRWGEVGWALTLVAEAPRKPVRIYQDVGLWEIPDSMVMTNRAFHAVLRAKGYETIYREYVGGHDYIAWRFTLQEGLIALLGRDPPSHLLP